MRVLFSALILMFASFQVFADEPKVLVKGAADQLLAEILENKAKVDSDNGFLANLIQEKLIPIVDQDRMAKLALGKNWKKASPEQKADFIEGFRSLLIRTYSGAFRAYNGQDVTYGKTRFDKTNTKAIVNSAIQQPGGNAIDIQYRLYKNKKTGEWKVFDAKVAGLGLLKTYRAQFAEQIQRDGLEKTIAQLKSGN